MAAPSHRISIAASSVSVIALPGFERWALGRLVPLAEAADLLCGDSVTIDEAVAFAVERSAGADLLAASSLSTFARIWRGFARFARLACGTSTVREVDHLAVERFLHASKPSGGRPSAATQQLRRTALRFLFRLLRDNGLAHHDPTLDVHLPDKKRGAVRPLTTEEVELCRAAAPATLVATREPAAWALLETGGSTSEIGNVRFRDLDIDGGVALLGAQTEVERIVPLSSWGANQLRRCQVPSLDSWVLVGTHDADRNGRRTRATELARNVIRRAGIAGPDVGARSVTAWVGAQVLAETGRIEEAARRLGFASLDATSRLIGHDWRNG